MSVQAAKDFIEKAKKNESIQKAVNERTKDLVDIGREHGHEFTRDEFRQAVKEHGGPPYNDSADPDTCVPFI